MSADYRTASFRGYAHKDVAGGGYLHVVYDAGQAVLGSLSLDEITELADMAGQAWPDDDRVEVRYEIQARRPGQKWRRMWSAKIGEGFPAEEDTEMFAWQALAGMSVETSLEWQLVRLTVLTAVEVLQPEPAPVAAVKARLEADGAQFRAAGLTRLIRGHDSGHDDGLGQDQG